MTQGEFIGLIVTVAICVLAIALMLLGWSHRKKRQTGIQAPETLPSSLTEPRVEGEGTYVVTTFAGQHLERIAAHELGVRCAAALSVGEDGVAIYRTEAENFYIPAEQIAGITTVRGMVGKFVEDGGVIVIRHSLGETSVDTGFRAESRTVHSTLLAALRKLAPEIHTQPESSTTANANAGAVNGKHPERTA